MGQYGVLHVKSIGKINSVRAYPNPTEGQYTVNFETTHPFSAEVYIIDISGKKVKQFNNIKTIPGSNSVNVDLSDLIGGTYYFHIEGESNDIVYQVIVVK